MTSVTADTVAPGIVYHCRYLPEGPWLLHAVAVQLRGTPWRVTGMRAHDARTGRERVSAMMRRLAARGDTALVAINADFFNLTTGEVENNTVIDGAWVKGVAPARPRSHAGVDADGRVLLGRYAFRGGVQDAEDRRAALGALNYRAARDSALVLFTRWYGERTPADSAAVEVPLRSLTDAAGSARYVAAGSVASGGSLAIPQDGAVLSGRGAAAEWLRSARGPFTVSTQFGPHESAPVTVVGGRGRLLENGRNVATLTDSLEGTAASFSAARHPRTAVGISRDSTLLWLVVVDGRRSWSAGMSLAELADAMLALGAWDAVNLDGGGSSTLWLRGTVANHPSDRTGERAVANALVIVPRRGRR